MNDSPGSHGMLRNALTGAAVLGLVAAQIGLWVMPATNGVAPIPGALFSGALWALFGGLIGAVAGEFERVQAAG